MLMFFLFVVVLPIVVTAALAAVEFFFVGSCTQDAVPQQDAVSQPSNMSWVGRLVMNKFNGLPDAHKPSYDVRAAVVALDVKYGIANLDSHFERHSTGQVLHCRCRFASHSTCQYYPEFWDMYLAMRKIEDARRHLAEAEARREREIELAGIQNDLRSVDDILVALRNEASIIHGAAREIS